MANKPITNLPIVEELKENATVFVNNDGVAAQVSVTSIGGKDKSEVKVYWRNSLEEICSLEGDKPLLSKVLTDIRDNKCFWISYFGDTSAADAEELATLWKEFGEINLNKGYSILSFTGVNHYTNNPKIEFFVGGNSISFDISKAFGD